MIQNAIRIFLITVIFTGCTSYDRKTSEKTSQGEIKYIHKLTSPNGQTEIYECFIESPMAFGSGNFKTTILKSGEKYNPRSSGNLSGYTILGWIGNDTLKVIKFHKKSDNEVKIPESKLHEIKKWGDIYLDISHRTSYGGGKAWFSFDSLYFSTDSVFFLQRDSLRNFKDTLGLLKGQIRLSFDNDTISIISGDYFERIEDHFAKVTEGNELGYPYVVGENCEIKPRYRLESSTFKEQAITIELDTKEYK